MKKRILFAVALTVMFVAAGCSSVLFSGRKRVLLYSDSQIMSLSQQSYDQFIDSVSLSRNTKMSAMVERVGKKMTSALEAYLQESGQTKYLTGLNWKFNLVESSEVNAFCMPSGQIVFYEGIMPYTSTDDFVAVVMGHEMAHAVARHGNERMSQSAVASAAGTIASVVVGQTVGGNAQSLFDLAFNVGAQYGVLLPYSRKHEYEADRIGLIIMAIAGYDVNQAPVFWEKMSAGGTSNVPQFMSTHPSDANRIAKINEYIPEALQYKSK